MMLHGDGKRDTYKHFFVEIDHLIGNGALDANEIACDGPWHSYTYTITLYTNTVIFKLFQKLRELNVC